MGFKCFVPNCNSGHNTCKEKVTMFAPPKDEELLMKWNLVIRNPERNITSKDRVCEKHFTIDQINAKWLRLDDIGEIIQDTNGKKSLKKGAIPTIFPVRSKNSNKAERRHLIKLDKSLNETSPAELALQASELLTDIPDFTKVNFQIQEQSSNPFLPIVKGYLPPERQANLFEILWKNPIALPSEAWGVHRFDSDDSRRIIYCEMSNYDNSVATICTKQVSIKEDMSVDVFLLNKKIDVSVIVNIQNPENTEDVEEFLYRVDTLQLCNGGPGAENRSFELSDMAYTDLFGKWRHNDCTLLSSMAKCKKCQSLIRIQNRKMRRKSPVLARPMRKVKRNIQKNTLKKMPRNLENKILLKKLRGDYDSDDELN